MSQFDVLVKSCFSIEMLDDPSLLENDSFMIFYSNLRKVLIDSILINNQEVNVRLICFLLGEYYESKKINRSISLLRLLSKKQKNVISECLSRMHLDLASCNKKESYEKVIRIIDWILLEDGFYKCLGEKFSRIKKVPSKDVIDIKALQYNREGDEIVKYLIKDLSNIHWYNISYEFLLGLLESRNYYLLSSKVYVLLIPAYLQMINDSFSVYTKFFYINEIDLYDFFAYLNTVEGDYKFDELDKEQKEYVGRFLNMMSELLDLIDSKEKVSDIITIPYWQEFL